MSVAKANKLFLKAVLANDTARAEELLKDGYCSNWNFETYKVDINKRDDKGRTIAMLTAEKAMHQITLWLVSKGIDITAGDKKFGNSLMHYAVLSGHHDLIRDLIDIAKIPANQTNNKGRTALHFAARRNINPSIISLLLDNGWEIDKADNAGGTALHDAVKEGHLNVVRLLLERGANPNLQNVNGNTALSCCFFDHRSSEYIRYPQSEIFKLLLAHGADPAIANNRGDKPVDEQAIKKYQLEQREEKPAADKPAPASLPKVGGTDHALRAAFESEGLDPDADEQWRPIGQSVIEHVIGGADTPRILVTTFNFVSRQCITTSKNLLTGQAALPSTMPMDQFNNPNYVADAHQRLLDAGKTPPPLWPNGLPAGGVKKNLSRNV